MPFVVVEPKPELQADLDRDGVLHLLGSGSDEQVLRQAGIDRAHGLICAVDSDAENVYVTLIAAPCGPTCSSWPAQPRTEHHRLYRAGADKVVSPYVTSGRRMANMAVRPHVVDFFDIARAGQPDLRLEELVVKPGSALVGRSLEEIMGAPAPLLIRRADGQLLANPGKQLRLEAGDTLVVYGEAAALRPLE